jgi:hypothetical protein
MSRVGPNDDCSAQFDAASARLSAGSEPPLARRPAPGSALNSQTLDEYEEAFDKLDSYLARATLNPAAGRRRVRSPMPAAQTAAPDRPRIAVRAAAPIASTGAGGSPVSARPGQVRRDDTAPLACLLGPNSDLASIQEALPLEQRAIMAFPSAQAEMAEGARCFGLGRHTACVFHMVRAAEYGLSALAHATDARRAVDSAGADWTDVIAQLEVRIAAIEAWRAEPEKLAALAFFQDALRDVHFMHAVAHKLAHRKSFFDGAQAGTICRTTRDFITRLSARVSESQKRTLSRIDFAEGGPRRGVG